MKTTTMPTKRIRRAAVLAAGALLTLAPTAPAQEQIGCFRGKPLPACKTF